MTLPLTQTGFPELYEQELVGPLFRPFAELLLNEVMPAPSDQVLDVACGTGIVARLAQERLGGHGKVVGVDLNPGMLAVANRVAPTIEWRQGDAANLPLAHGEQFTVVLCQQGLQFVTDRPAAAREMRRALAPGGRLAVSTWLPDEEMPVLLALRRIAEQHVGPITDRRHSFGGREPLEGLLIEASFHSVRTTTASRMIRFQNGETFVRLNAMALAGMGAGSAELTDESRGRVVAAIVRDSASVVAAHSDAAGFAYEIRATTATATA